MKWNSDLKDCGRPSFKCNALSLRRQGKKCKTSHAICTNRNITQFSQIDQSVSWYKTSLFQELKQAKEILEKPQCYTLGLLAPTATLLGGQSHNSQRLLTTLRLHFMVMNSRPELKILISHTIVKVWQLSSF